MPVVIPDFFSTREAAAVLRRTPGLLRKWACSGGPVNPVRINGAFSPLLWRRSDIEKLMGAEITEIPTTTGEEVSP